MADEEPGSGDRSGADGEDAGADVLRSQRAATRYQILVEIAERQPAVSQGEIAGAIGVTPQAVSDYLGDLTADDFVRTHGRGRYEVTKAGVDWLIARTDDLREYVDHVAETVIGQVEVETALATAAVTEGQRVRLTMRDGVLQAAPVGDDEADDGATAVAVTDAAAGTDVGVADVRGLVEYDLGTVTIVTLPPVREAGSRVIDLEQVASLAGTHDLLAAAGVEAVAAARAAGYEPDLRFGTPAAVREAATKGLDVLLLVVATALSAHTDELRAGTVRYEVTDGREFGGQPPR